MTVLYNDNKQLWQLWQFRPSGHWNFVPESVYEVLTKFYGSDRLRVIKIIEEE